MKNTSKFYVEKHLSFLDRVIYLLFIPFFIWSFLGGWRQQIHGVVSDHIASGLALLGCFAIIIRQRSMPKLYIEISIIYLLFIVIALFSFLTAEWNYSIYAIVPSASYFYITIGLSIFFRGRPTLFFRTVMFAVIFSGIFIFFAYMTLGMSSWGRITIPYYANGEFAYFSDLYSDFTDPNLLAYYLGFGVLSMIFFNNHRLSLPCICLVGFALTLTLSRSAIAGVAFSFFVMFLAQPLRWISWLKMRKFFIFIITPVAFLCAYLFLDLSPIYEMIGERIYGEISNSDRIDRLIFAINLLEDSGFYFFTGRGVGYSSEMLDPHNFYLSTVIDTGFLSVALLLLILFFLFYKIASHGNKDITAAAAVFISFFIFISLFYWQVRTYYFVVLLLLVLENFARISWYKSCHAKISAPV